jgi:hypothetical protein
LEPLDAAGAVRGFVSFNDSLASRSWDSAFGLFRGQAITHLLMDSREVFVLVTRRRAGERLLHYLVENFVSELSLLQTTLGTRALHKQHGDGVPQQVARLRVGARFPTKKVALPGGQGITQVLCLLLPKRCIEPMREAIPDAVQGKQGTP